LLTSSIQIKNDGRKFSRRRHGASCPLLSWLALAWLGLAWFVFRLAHPILTILLSMAKSNPYIQEEAHADKEEVVFVWSCHVLSSLVVV
jgi:hypothetical protein